MRIPSFEESPRRGLAILGGAADPSLAFLPTVEMTTALDSQSSCRTRDLFFHLPLLRGTSARSQKAGLRFQGVFPAEYRPHQKPLP